MRRAWILFLMVFVPAAASAVQFLDTVGHPHEQQIDELQILGVVEGYGYGIFRPDISINRAEFLKILMLAVFGNEGIIPLDSDRCFEDFVGEPKWFWPHACLAKERGIINGYPDGTFRGEKTVNLAEALKISMEAWGIELPPYVNTPEYWYLPYFAVAEQKGLFEYFPRQGGHLLTRSEMAYTIIEMNEPLQDATRPARPVSPAPSTSSSPPMPVSPTCGNGTLDPGEQCDDGNSENGDGCSETCMIVTEPVHHGALRIDQRPIDASSVSAGAKGVTLYALDAIAGRQDVELTRLVFRAAAGSFADVTNFTLHADTNNDGKVDQVVASATAESDRVAFGAFATLVPDGGIVHMELRADILENATGTEIAAEIDVSDNRAIEGVGTVDGRDLTGIELNGGDCTEASICWIALNTTAVQKIDIQLRGNLFVAVDSTPVPSRILLGGEISDDLLRFTMRAEGEEVEVTRITINGGLSSFSQMVLYEDGEEEPLAAAFVTVCNTLVLEQFCANTSLTVKPGEEVTIAVRANMKAEEEGGKSGEDATISLQGATVEAIEARGLESQADLVPSDGDSQAEGEIFIGRSNPGPNNNIVGSTHETTYAKLLDIENANPDADGDAVPSGTSIFGRFKFTAARNANALSGVNDVRLRDVVFTVNASNVKFLSNSFVLMNMEDTSTTTDCIASDDTGVITVTCSNLHQSDIGAQVASEQSITLGLQGLVINPQVAAGTSTLQASIESLGSHSSAGDISWDDEETIFSWFDIGKTSVRSTTYSSN